MGLLFMEESDKKNRNIIQSTWRQALYLWVGLNLSLTLFFIQSQVFFMNSGPFPHFRLEWIFSVLGFTTFLFGLLFFKYFTTLRMKKLRMMTPEERKQSLLVAFVVQFVLFETLGLYGVLLSVITQNPMKSLPFIISAYLGFIVTFPGKGKIRVFFTMLFLGVWPSWLPEFPL